MSSQRRRRQRRRLAQNFLVDPVVVDRLTDQLRFEPGDRVLDLGAGAGALTEAAARRGAAVTAVERDPHWVDHLRRKAPGWGGVTVLSADVLTMEMPVGRYFVISNAPFLIGTKLVRRVLTDCHGMAGAVFVLQREAARRLAGEAGAGRFAATWAPWFDLQVGPAIGPGSFDPAPDVTAAALRVTPRPDPLISPAAFGAYVTFVDRVFEGRGTTLRQRLAGMAGKRTLNRRLAVHGVTARTTPSEVPPEVYALVFSDLRPAM